MFKLICGLGLLCLLALAVSGCAHDPPKVQAGTTVETTDKDGNTVVTTKSNAVVKLEAAMANRPLFDMKCPAQGCTMLSLTVYNPQQVALPPEEPAPVNPWLAAFDRVMGAAERIAPFGFMYGISREAFKALEAQPNPSYSTTNITSNSGNTSLQTSTSSTTNTTNTTSTSLTNTNSNNRTATGGNTTTGNGGGATNGP